MSRGRHARPGRLARLWPRRRRVRLSLRIDRLRELEREMSSLRVLGIAHAVAAASADIRAGRAEQALVGVDEELMRLRTELATTRTDLDTTRTELAGVRLDLDTTRTELAGVRLDLDTTRTELAGVREDLLWAFAKAPAAGRHSTGHPSLVDLRDGAARTG